MAAAGAGGHGDGVGGQGDAGLSREDLLVRQLAEVERTIGQLATENDLLASSSVAASASPSPSIGSTPGQRPPGPQPDHLDRLIAARLRGTPCRLACHPGKDQEPFLRPVWHDTRAGVPTRGAERGA